MMAEFNVNIERLLVNEHAKTTPVKRLPPLAAVAKEFRAYGEDRYRIDVSDLGLTIEIDRLRRERHELIGELSVYFDLPGASTVNGSLSIADVNLSSARARQDRAKLLAARANTREHLDWDTLIEEFCQRVL